MISLILLLAAATSPEESLRLARRVAEGGAIAAMLPAIEAKDTQELIAEHPQLSPTDKQALLASAHRTFLRGRERLMEATARGYAERLSVKDMRVLVKFQATRAARNHAAATPAVIAGAMKAMGPVNFKADAVAVYCRESGNLCPPAK